MYGSPEMLIDFDQTNPFPTIHTMEINKEYMIKFYVNAHIATWFNILEN